MKDEDKIETLKLSTRIYNALKAAGLNTIGAVKLILPNITSIRRIGVKGRDELERKINNKQ